MIRGETRPYSSGRQNRKQSPIDVFHNGDKLGKISCIMKTNGPLKFVLVLALFACGLSAGCEKSSPPPDRQAQQRQEDEPRIPVLGGALPPAAKPKPTTAPVKIASADRRGKPELATQPTKIAAVTPPAARETATRATKIAAATRPVTPEPTTKSTVIAAAPPAKPLPPRPRPDQPPSTTIVARAPAPPKPAVEPAKPIEPMPVPPKPAIEPAKPVEPVPAPPKPAVEPAKPVEPVPVPPKPAVEPAKPIEPKPTPPKPAIEPAEPVGPKPVPPIPVVEPAKPVEPVPAPPKPAIEPAKPVEPAPVPPKPAVEPAKPIEPKPVPPKPAIEPAKPVGPKPVPPVPVVEPAKPVEPKPVPPKPATRAAKPAGPVEPKGVSRSVLAARSAMMMQTFDRSEWAKHRTRLPATAAAGRSNSDPKAHMLDGDRALARGDFEGAVKSFYQAFDIAPHRIEVLQGLSIALTAARRYREAMAIYEMIFAITPKDRTTRFNTAVALSRLHRFAEAEAIYEKLVEEDETFIEAHYNLATLYQVQGKLGQARGAWLAITSQPQCPPSAYTYLGEVLLDLGDPQAAYAAFEIATRREPKVVSVWLNLAAAARLIGSYGMAVVATQRAAELAPEDPTIWKLLGQTQLELHRVSRKREHLNAAVKSWRESLRLDPNQPQLERLVKAYGAKSPPATAPAASP